MGRDPRLGGGELSTYAEPETDVAPEVQRHRSFTSELPFLAAVALVLALLIKAFLVQPFYIPSGSMEQTLLINDRVLVNKLVYRFRDVHRGEVVVFNGVTSWSPEVAVPKAKNVLQALQRKVLSLTGLGQSGEKDFIKRVIGIPGDTVACCTDGHVTVNGEVLVEPYLYEDDRRTFPPTTVPEGKLWVMGDHRGQSSDSRINGLIPIDKVIGRAFVVLWPPRNARVLRVPPPFAPAEALPAPPWSLLLMPPVLGLSGAVPIAWGRRSWRRRRGLGRRKSGD